MFPILHPAPVRRITRSEQTFLSSKTTAVFFDVDLLGVPLHSQIFLGLCSPFGRGVTVQIDAQTGCVHNPQNRGQLLGVLDTPLARSTRISLELEKEGRHWVSRLFVKGAELALPAFYLPSPGRLNAVCGYVAATPFSSPKFGRHELLTWVGEVEDYLPR